MTAAAGSKRLAKTNTNRLPSNAKNPHCSSDQTIRRCYTFSLAVPAKTRYNEAAMLNASQNSWSATAEKSLCKELLKNHYTMPLDALTSTEVAEHITEAVETFIVMTWPVEDAAKIRENVRRIQCGAAPKISAMSADELRAAVMTRMRSLAEEIGAETDTTDDSWRETSRQMVMLDAARQCLALTFSMFANAQRHQAPAKSEVTS